MSETVRHSELVFDLSLYPRQEVDHERAEHLSEVLKAGRTLPPIIIDKKRRVVDGFHRARAYRIAKGEDAAIPCEVHEYDDEKSLFLDAIRRNAGHGKPFDGTDRKHCAALAQRYGVTVEALAGVLNVRAQRVASLMGTSRPVHQVSAKAAMPAMREASSSYTGYGAPIGLGEINAVIAALRTNRIDLHDAQITESLRNLVRVSMESLKARAA